MLSQARSTMLSRETGTKSNMIKKSVRIWPPIQIYSPDFGCFLLGTGAAVSGGDINMINWFGLDSGYGGRQIRYTPQKSLEMHYLHQPCNPWAQRQKALGKD